MPVHLDCLIINNFKSFRGKVVISPRMPFTAIAGRNGSGKSNIMDAISFALGEKANNLRVPNYSQLIHGANVGKPIARSAYVTVFFILEDKSNIKFTRSVAATSCKYEINDELVSLESYTLKLIQLGLNVKTKNFLISQGAIESIAMKATKEYTEMIETISNSIELKAEYEKLRLEQLEMDNEVRCNNHSRKDLLTRKKCALKEKEEADVYKDLQKECLKAKLQLQLFQLYHTAKDVRDLEIEADGIQEKVREYESDKSLATDLLKQKKDQFVRLSKQLMVNENNYIQAENVFRKKETEHILIKEQVSYWETELQSHNARLSKAQIIREKHTKVIEELTSKLAEVEEMKAAFEANMKTQLLSQGSTVELTNSQVQEYSRLKKIAHMQSSEHALIRDSLKEVQIGDQNMLDNEERKRMELEHKLQQVKIMMEETEKGLEKHKTCIAEAENVLQEKIQLKSDLEESINKYRDRRSEIQNELETVCEQLGDAKIDKQTVERLKRKEETIQALKGLFPDVYGRLSDLCKPVHSRYNVAVVKVFGKHMDAIIVRTTNIAKQCIYYLKEQQLDAETFLPLDYLKANPVSERLRNIKEPKNVKLLYDVLQFQPSIINAAILFVTNNCLVCETAKDANFIAYNLDSKYKHNCVALDGTFYRKDGIISGGQAELSRKARIWEEKKLSELKAKKISLTEELRQLLKLPAIESEKSTVEAQIQGISTKLKYMKYSFLDAEKQILVIKNEIDTKQDELKSICTNIDSIKASMNERNERILSTEKYISNIEDSVFQNFCESIGISDIRKYESNDLRAFQEESREKLKITNCYDRIKNLLDFEMQRNTQSEISQYESAVESAKQKLEIARLEDASSRNRTEKEKHNLLNLRYACEATKAEITELEKSIDECRKSLSVISKLIQDTQRNHIIILTNIEKKLDERRAIVKHCKVEGIPIPLLADVTVNSSENTDEDSAVSDSSPTVSKILSLLDFAKLPEHLKSREEQDIRNCKSALARDISEIHGKLESIENPNLKADDKVEATKLLLRDAEAYLKDTRQKANEVRFEFEKIKQERYKRFASCLEKVAAEVDVIYKCLVNDESAQAILLPENPEEPYLQGITYSCIVPGKRFQPLSNLSGGEKTLAALALLFAIHSYAPSPFFVLDEVDAALDKTNIKHLVNFIRSKSANMQFIIISLKKEMFTCADALIGACTDTPNDCAETLVFTLDLTRYPKRQKVRQ